MYVIFIVDELVPFVAPVNTFVVIVTSLVSLPLIASPPAGKLVVYSILLFVEVIPILFNVPALSPDYHTLLPVSRSLLLLS